MFRGRSEADKGYACTLINAPINTYTTPAAIRPPMVAPTPQVWIPNMIGAMNAKEDAKKIGTERRVISWNKRVPIPAPKRQHWDQAWPHGNYQKIKAANSICAPCKAFFM